jgi:acyl-CoA thioester hydrolase
MTPWAYSLTLRPTDIDYLGHVTAAAYLAFFEEARVRWLGEAWQMPRPTYVLARQELDYLGEIRADDAPLTVTIAVARLGTSSFDVAEELMIKSGECKNRSRATLVAWDPDRRRSRPLEETERTALSAQLIECGAPQSGSPDHA